MDFTTLVIQAALRKRMLTWMLVKGVVLISDSQMLRLQNGQKWNDIANSNKPENSYKLLAA